MVLNVRQLVMGGLVAAGLATMIGVPAAQQTPAGQQGAGQQGAGRGRGNFNSFFTGKIDVGSTMNERMSRIRFEAGARTNWHIHTAPQLLLVEQGRGRLQELGSAIVDVPEGQPVLTKPNLLHWHGAAPDRAALQFSVYSGELEWKEAVSDDEYSGKTVRK
jgi:quercetin dioxygenase-like cupin family protein